jgi:hypothetical protein
MPTWNYGSGGSSPSERATEATGQGLARGVGEALNLAGIAGAAGRDGHTERANAAPAEVTATPAAAELSDGPWASVVIEKQQLEEVGGEEAACERKWDRGPGRDPRPAGEQCCSEDQGAGQPPD